MTGLPEDSFDAPNAVGVEKTADSWLCPKCGRENRAELSCPHCGHLRHWQSSSDRMEKPSTAFVSAAPGSGHSVPGAWTCPACGKRNSRGEFCSGCGAAGDKGRPGCLTAYAILLWMQAAGWLLGILFSAVGFSGDSSVATVVFFASWFLIQVVLAVATGIGIWRMRKWGWTLAIVFQFVPIVAYWLYFALSLTGAVEPVGDLTTFVCTSVMVLTYSGVIIAWFVRNRTLFDG